MPIGPRSRASAASVSLEVLDHALVPRLVVAAAADRADVEGLGLQRLQQRQVVQLGIVRQATTQLRRSGLNAVTTSSGMSAHHRDAGHAPRAAVFLARIAHRHGEAAEQRHRGEVLGQLAGADQQHAVLGAEGVDQLASRRRSVRCGDVASASVTAPSASRTVRRIRRPCFQRAAPVRQARRHPGRTPAAVPACRRRAGRSGAPRPP